MNRFSADLAARRVLFLSSLDKVRGGVVISRVGRGTPELPFDNSSCHSPMHAPFTGHCVEWAHRDSNPEPKDYAYHFGFRRRQLAVRGLDHAFTMPLSAKVGDYGLYTLPRFRAGLARRWVVRPCEQAVHRIYT